MVVNESVAFVIMRHGDPAAAPTSCAQIGIVHACATAGTLFGSIRSCARRAADSRRPQQPAPSRRGQRGRAPALGEDESLALATLRRGGPAGAPTSPGQIGLAPPCGTPGTLFRARRCCTRANRALLT